ncbi:uncharacterized protein J3D65DRAFT_640359 [Phyllosticta citribraziliensis]|uniref:AMP-activated protein kinase glycogen-binding domain-containing protein n=1 Tax=Phyllosticta citribraziliensis TaxID=989973 RepID=A0ABR1L4I7_9PEZI
MDLSRPKIPVTITFYHPSTSPPVFVATSLTNPPWQVVEMDVKQERTPSGDLIFEKKFDAVEAGEYQYKFRLGPGDWWVCDDNAPTGTYPPLSLDRTLTFQSRTASATATISSSSNRKICWQNVARMPAKRREDWKGSSLHLKSGRVGRSSS